MSDDLPIYNPLSSKSVADMPVPPWRIKGILPTQGLAAIYGQSTAGKSFLAIDIAAAIAFGNTWFGHRVRKAPVLYIALEGEGGFPKRLNAWKQYNESPFPENLRFIINQPFNITDPLHVAQLAIVIQPGSVIIIDTLNRSAPDTDENTSKDMGAILAGCKRLQHLTQSLVVLIHHTGKDESKGLRGHSSLLAAVDACIEVKRSDDTRSWSVAKAKDDADGAEFCFRLVIEHLGTDAEGDPITSCAIEPTTESAPPRSGKSGLKANEKAVLEAIVAALESCPLLPWDEALEAAKNALAEHVDTKHRSVRANKALHSLINKGKLKRDEDTNLITIGDYAS